MQNQETLRKKRENLWVIQLGQEHLDMPPKAQSVREKKINWTSVKDPTKRIKNQSND